LRTLRSVKAYSAISETLLRPRSASKSPQPRRTQHTLDRGPASAPTATDVAVSLRGACATGWAGVTAPLAYTVVPPPGACRTSTPSTSRSVITMPAALTQERWLRRPCTTTGSPRCRDWPTLRARKRQQDTEYHWVGASDHASSRRE